MEKLVNEIRSLFEDFPISTNDLQNPTSVFIVRFFCRILHEFYADIENVKKVQIQQTEWGIHEIDILPSLNFLKAMRLFSFLRFGLFDILNPTAKRTMELVGEMLNFWRFCDELLAKLDLEVQEYREAKEQLEEYAHLKEEMLLLYNKVTLEKEEYIRKIESRKGEMEEKAGYLQELNDRVNTLKEEENSLNAKDAQVDTEIAELEYELSTLDAEINVMKKEVVENPEKLEHELMLKEQEKIKIDEQKTDIWNKLKAKSEQKKQLEEALEAANRLVQHEDTIEIINRLRQKQERLSLLNEEILKLNNKELKEKELKNLMTQIEDEEKSLKELEAKFIQDQEQLKHSVEENKRLFSEELTRLANTETERCNRYKQLKEVEQQITDLKAEFALKQAAFNKVLKAQDSWKLLDRRF